MALDIDLIRNNYLFIIANEFITTDNNKLAIINGNINLASEDVNEDVFGSKTNRAIALLTAHNLKINGFKIDDTNVNSNISGSITKIRQKWDRVEEEVTYSGNSFTGNNSEALNSEWGGSQYGIQFFNLLKSCSVGMGAFVV